MRNNKLDAEISMHVIVLVGVAHVIDIKSSVEKIIIQENPDIVAVELDYGRYLALTNKIEGKMPYLYRKMAEMQKNLARMMGTAVGEEMLTAIQIAVTFNKRVAFIDMDAMEIAHAIRKSMRVIEKLKLYFSLIFAPFFGRRVSREEVEKIVDREEEYISYIRKKYPGLSKALFDIREERMAENLKKLENEGKVVAFVGDGHISGLKKKLPNVEVIRLRELMGDTFSFSVKIGID